MNTEKNRNKRRDKKIARKKAGMRVDDSAKKLAKVRYQRYNIWPGIGMPRE